MSRQIELLTAAGEAQAGWELVSTGLEMAGQAAIRDHCIMLVHAAGIRNRLSVSDLDAAELVQAALQHDTATSLCPVCSVDKHAAMAAYYVAAGDLTTALEYTQQALHLAQSAHNRLGEARALYVHALLHAAHGATADAETCLAEAAGMFRELNDRYDLAQTLHVWGDLPASDRASHADRAVIREEARRLETQFRTDSCR